MKKNKHYSNLSILIITILCIGAGILVSVQINNSNDPATSLTEQDLNDLAALAESSNSKRISLKEKLDSLSESVLSLEQENISESELLKQLNEDNVAYAIANGTTELKGKGITITFNNDEFLISTDLLDITNELWGAGAEAIAINGERITYASSFSSMVTKNHTVYLTVNNKKLKSPIVITALGDKETLHKAAIITGGIIENLSVEPTIQEENEVTIPAARKK